MATRSPLSPYAVSGRALTHEASIERRAVAFPTIISGLMAIIGVITGKLAGIDGTGLIGPYFLASFSITLITLLVFIFVEFSKLAVKLAPNPIQTVWRMVLTRAPLLLVPLVVLPVFLTGFSTAKCSIPVLVGYHWDPIWANVDHLMFGNDAWRIAHAIVPKNLSMVGEWFYSTVWVLVLALFGPCVALYATPRRAGILFTAMLATWVVAGWFLAYCFSSAGPIFVHLTNISLAERFQPLLDAINDPAFGGAKIRRTQDYLSVAMYASFAVKGGGISAMPSMHLGVTSIYVLAARRTRWLMPALALWAVIFIGSAYFGYHYWIDGIVAAGVAWLCWRVTESLFAVERLEAASSS